MKQNLLTFIFLSFIINYSIGQTPIYLNFVSHNEVSDPYDYVNSSNDYWLVTDVAKEIADTIISRQAKWNVQVDANYIFGNLNHDNAATNPNDFLEWANNSPYIDVDGHNHFDASVNPYNYADLAHLLDSCGVVFSVNEVAGTWMAPLETWTPYQSPVQGYTYTNYSYQADLLWGGGTPSHSNDINDFGVWKPTGPNSALEFRTHAPQNHLTYIGSGCKDKIEFALDPLNGEQKLTTDEIISNLKAMSDYFNSLPSGPNDFYTLNFLINFRDFPQIPSFADSIAKIIDGIQPYVDNGKIIWATLADKYNTWYNLHTDPFDHFSYKCEDTPLIVEDVFNDDDFSVYPNPSQGNIEITCNKKIERMEIIDNIGNTIYNVESPKPNQNKFSFQLSKGIYFIKIITSSSTVTKKIEVY